MKCCINSFFKGFLKRDDVDADGQEGFRLVVCLTAALKKLLTADAVALPQADEGDKLLSNADDSTIIA